MENFIKVFLFVCFFTDSKLFCDIPDLSLEI